MSDAAPPRPQLVMELKVSAHLMQLEAGVYCVYHTPGSAPPDPATGLPGARLSLPPGHDGRDVTITGFRDDGWLGSPDAAALIRVAQGPAQVLMTIYQAQDSEHEPPRLQVTKLIGPAPAAIVPPADGLPSLPPAAAKADLAALADAEIAAHLQMQGDVAGRLGEWVGERGNERWVEGFSISPKHAGISPQEIEYQAVLGRGWLSPWAEGGQYCGSRGMALPILGLRVRLRGKAAETQTVEVNATFTDGTAIGPVGPGEACEAASLAPLEAFCVSVVPLDRPQAAPAAKRPGSAAPELAAARRISRTKSPAAPATDEPSPTKPARGRRG